MIVEREKEFEDGLFYSELAAGQQAPGQVTNFAGIDLSNCPIPREEVKFLSLKQLLVKLDRENFERKNGIVPSKSSKRKLDSMESAEDGPKRRKVPSEGFLDVGSVSWSLLLAAFILSLHKGAAPVSSPDAVQEKYCITYESILEMLEVLVSEFGDMIPLESNQ